MALYGLIGYPLTHSFSKKYFTEKFAAAGLSGNRYENFPIRNIDEIRQVLASHPDLAGLNVTIPYKEEVVPYLDEASAIVRKLGACNCIRVEQGRLSGHNTDVIGFENTFSPALKPHHKKALVLGTGGAAKAVVYVLEKLGIGYHFVSRKPGVHRYSYEQLNDRLIREYPVIINTTPLGMYPGISEAPPIPYTALNASHYLYDLIYNPEKTRFLQMGEAHGASVHNGAGMLVIQAEESWKIWNA